MTVYVAQAYIAFDGADQNDEWALGLAQWVKDNTEVLGGQALITPGTAGERSSYCVVSEMAVDGSLTTLSAWHVDDSGVLVQGLPDGSGAPPSVKWDPNAVAYAIDDVVEYNKAFYRCIQAHTSQAAWTPDTTASLWTAI